MAAGRLVWDSIGEKIYETGCSKGVLYRMNTEGEYKPGVAWNGIGGVTESPTGGEATSVWADDIKYLSLLSAEEFGGTLEAYMYPDEFEDCDGSREISPGVTIGQQNRTVFGLSYVTIVGNDVLAEDYGYKIHLIYGAKATPSERSYKTKNDSPEATSMSWKLETTPVPVTGFKPTANVVLNSTKIPEKGMKAIEDVLYGSETEEARLPLPDEIKSIIDAAVEVTG